MKRILSILLALVCLLPCLILPLAAAGSATETPRDFSSTTVDEDLIGSEFRNGLGTVTEIKSVADIATTFPINESADPQILEVMEVGYDADKGSRSDITLYVWIYVPDTGFDPVSAKNKVTLANAFDKNPLGTGVQKAEKWTASSYAQYNLSYVGTSTSGTVHKFTVGGFDATGCISGGERRYNISRFDLHYIGESTARNYKEGRSYICTGSIDSGDYEAAANGLDVLEIKDLYQTTFRYYNLGDQEGDGELDRMTQINSVYFSIPKEFEEQIKEFVSITCDWKRYRSTPMIVTVDEELYNEYSKYIRMYVGVDSVPKYSLYGLTYTDTVSSSSFQSRIFGYNRHYNHNASWAKDEGLFYNYAMLEDVGGSANILTLFWLFAYKGADNAWGNDDIKEACISSREVVKWYESQVKAGMGTGEVGLITNGVITKRYDSVYGPHNETIFASDTQDDLLKGYEYSSVFSRFWDALSGDMKETESIEGVTAIQKISLSDYIDLISEERQREAVCKKYLIDDADYEHFKKFCSTETTAGNTVVVFHFANSVYEVQKAAVCSEDVWGNTSLAYMSTQDIFLDFTMTQTAVIDKYDRTRIIPMSTPNVDVIGPINPDPGGDIGDLIDDTIKDPWEEFMAKLQELWTQIEKVFTVIIGLTVICVIILVVMTLLKPIEAAGRALDRGAENARRRREEREKRNRRNKR